MKTNNIRLRPDRLKFPLNIYVVGRLSSAVALATALQLTTLAAVPISWTATPTSPTYMPAPVPHGSTVEFSVTLKGFTDPAIGPDADVRLWFQTNGMGSAWFSAPAAFASNVVTATFGPEQDVGADRVNCFFGAPSNVFASAVLRLSHAPGFTPTYITPPVLTIDFDILAVTNAPYYTKAETDTKIVELAPMPDVSQKADKVKTASCAWSAYCETWYSHPTPLAQVSPTNWLFTSGPRRLGGPSIQLNRVGGLGDDGFWEFAYGVATSTVYIPGTNSAPASAMQLEFEIVSLDVFGNVSTNLWTVSRTNEVYISVAYLDDVPTKFSQLENDIPFATPGDVTAATNNSKEYTDSAIPPAVSNVVTKSYVEALGIESGLQEEADPVWSAEKSNYATKTELATVEGKADAAALDASSALRIVLGESVWFAVTNYMRTADGVIPSLQLWEVRDSATNLVYDSREEITNVARVITAELRTEMTNRIHDVENIIPSKAWGNYQSDGTDNPQPGEVAIVNQPTVILTGGGTFNKYIEVGDSSVWVLQSSGPVSFGGNTNGNFFAVLDDEGNSHFRVAKTESYDLPAFISGILPRQSQDHILIYTATTNRHGNAVSDPPILSASSDLKSSWHEEVEGEIDALGITVSWAKDETIPAWVATVTPDTYPPRLFFRAKVVQEGGVAIINEAPTRFDGGIQIGNGTYRLVPYTTGGKTYLTLEGMP